MFFTFCILFFVACSTQIVYWLFYYFEFNRIIKCQSQNSLLDPKRPVSIIICAKNEAHNIVKTVSKICKQQYHNYEVIFIDDNSTDNTWLILQSLSNKYPNLFIYKNENNKHWKGKKSALDFGIQKAKYDAILVTDADCAPQSEYWIANMMAIYQNNIVLGFGPYYVGNIKFLPQWIQWETLHTFIQYSTYAQAGNAYMGVGRNLLYPKHIYLKALQNVEFLGLYNTIPSGDDDLLLQEMVKHSSVNVQLNPETFMYSVAPLDWKDYWKQKSRHASTGKYYSNKTKWPLAIYAATHSLSLVLGLGLIIYSIIAYINGNLLCTLYGCYDLLLAKCVVFLFALRYFVYEQLWTKIFKKLYGDHLKSNFLIRGDLFWAIYNLILSPYIFFKNKQKWK